MAQLDLPGEADFATLSHRACVAIAARCARYVLPVVIDYVSGELSDQYAGVAEQTLDYAERFAAGESVQERDVPQMIAMAQIAKTATQECESAHERGDYVRDFMTEAAYCAAWAVDFAARAARSEIHAPNAALESMGYAAKAYIAQALARLFVSGSSQDRVTEETNRLVAEVSHAFRADFDVVKKHQAFPRERFGSPRLRCENVSLPSEWQNVPVFISSTFADMQPERDYLRDVVFPQLEEALQTMAIRPIPVDLRWGISTTSSADEIKRQQEILKVCFHEIDRCHPYFIALLGDRYGWVLPDENVRDALQEVGADFELNVMSITALEITYAMHNSANLLLDFCSNIRHRPGLLRPLQQVASSL